jgi:D-glycero-D-manno-heptose 1,7-bisphosphate phosphatase
MKAEGLRPAVFLDRDGTLIEEKSYLTRPEQVRVLPGVGLALARLRAAGFACVVVTNQSAIGRGMMTEADLQRVHEELLRQLRAVGAELDALYHCPFVPTSGDMRVIEHPERKPAPGMLLRAARELRLDLARSWMVGDQLSDYLAGRNAGCQGSLLVRTGHPLAAEPDCPLVDDLGCAVDIILAAQEASADSAA